MTFCDVTNLHRHVIARRDNDADVGQPDDHVPGHGDVERAVKRAAGLVGVSVAVGVGVGVVVSVVVGVVVGVGVDVVVGVVEVDFPFQGSEAQCAVSGQTVRNVL